jgi:hypothetical protein
MRDAPRLKNSERSARYAIRPPLAAHSMNMEIAAERRRARPATLPLDHFPFGPRGVRPIEPAATGPLQVEMRVALVASRVYEPERIPTLRARPQVRNLGSPRLDIGRHLMHVSRPARGTFLLGTDGDIF